MRVRERAWHERVGARFRAGAPAVESGPRAGGWRRRRTARACVRAGGETRGRSKFQGKQSSFYLLLSDSNLDARDTRGAVSKTAKTASRILVQERASRNLCGTAKCERVSRFFFRAQKVGGFHRIARASSCLGHVPPRHPFPPPLNPPSTDHLLNTTTSAANATTPPAARNGALSCPEPRT